MTRIVHHFKGARSVRLLWMLEELGLAYEVARESIAEKSDALKRRHPLAKIPCFVDGDVIIQESTAAVDYLANRYGGGAFAVKPDEADYPLYLQWLHAAEPTLMQPIFMVVAHTMLFPEDKRRPSLAEAGRASAHNVFRWLDRDLKGRDFLAEGRMSAADVALGYACYVGRYSKVLTDDFPEVRRYWDGLKARPAARRALAA